MMDERVAPPPWELAATPFGFVRTWLRVTFHPKVFASSLTEPASLVPPALYALVALSLSVVLLAAVTAATTYSSLQRFGAPESLGRIFAHQMGWYAGNLVCAIIAAGLSTWLASSLARRRFVEALRARMYTLAPLTSLIAWWVMFRWLEIGFEARAWRPKVVALAGLIAETALAAALSSILAGPIGDAIFDLFYWRGSRAG